MVLLRTNQPVPMLACPVELGNCFLIMTCLPSIGIKLSLKIQPPPPPPQLGDPLLANNLRGLLPIGFTPGTIAPYGNESPAWPWLCYWQRPLECSLSQCQSIITNTHFIYWSAEKVSCQSTRRHVKCSQSAISGQVPRWLLWQDAPLVPPEWALFGLSAHNHCSGRTVAKTRQHELLSWPGNR